MRAHYPVAGEAYRTVAAGSFAVAYAPRSNEERGESMETIKGSSTVEIEAPIEQVWEVVEDVVSAPEWQDGLKDVEELERDDDGHVTLVESSSDAKVRTIKSTVRFEYDGPTRLSWSHEKGDLKSVDGSWELEDLG